MFNVARKHTLSSMQKKSVRRHGLARAVDPTYAWCNCACVRVSGILISARLTADSTSDTSCRSRSPISTLELQLNVNTDVDLYHACMDELTVLCIRNYAGRLILISSVTIYCITNKQTESVCWALIGQFKLIITAHQQELLDPPPLIINLSIVSRRGVAGQINNKHDSIILLRF